MLSIYYREEAAVRLVQHVEDLQGLVRERVLWIDLFSPTGDEKRGVETFLGTEIQSRAQAEEIESSSRFSETENAIFANTYFLIPGPDDYTSEAVSFTLVGPTLTTLRDVPLRSFTELQRRIVARPALYAGGYDIFATILDQRIDLDADMIELMSKEISQYSKRINQQEDINEEFLLDINQLQENTMLVRENIVDKQRLVNNLLKSPKLPKELRARFRVMLQDIASLINHTNFSFERLEYIQDTVLGLINLDQNKIMKIFTIVSLLFMPPTLVASFYGMNVDLPGGAQAGGWHWVWLVIVLGMAVSVGLILLIFRRKKLL